MNRTHHHTRLAHHPSSLSLSRQCSDYHGSVNTQFRLSSYLLRTVLLSLHYLLLLSPPLFLWLPRPDPSRHHLPLGWGAPHELSPRASGRLIRSLLFGQVGTRGSQGFVAPGLGVHRPLRASRPGATILGPCEQGPPGVTSVHPDVL